jgi:hypothetical protein
MLFRKISDKLLNEFQKFPKTRMQINDGSTCKAFSFFLQSFSSLACNQTDLMKFLTFFQENRNFALFCLKNFIVEQIQNPTSIQILGQNG